MFCLCVCFAFFLHKSGDSTCTREGFTCFCMVSVFTLDLWFIWMVFFQSKCIVFLMWYWILFPHILFETLEIIPTSDSYLLFSLFFKVTIFIRFRCQYYICFIKCISKFSLILEKLLEQFVKHCTICSLKVWWTFCVFWGWGSENLYLYHIPDLLQVMWSLFQWLKSAFVEQKQP